MLAEKSKYPGVHTIVTFDPTSEDENKQAESLGVKLYTFEEVKKFGQDNRIAPSPGDTEDLVTIMYTSGFYFLFFEVFFKKINDLFIILTSSL